MSQLKIAQGMTDELLGVIHKYDKSLPLVSVLGVLEIVKLQLVQEHMEDEDAE